MHTFLTGSTGYIGAHVLACLLEGHNEPINLLVRASSREEAEHRLWRSLQLHMEFDPFFEHLRDRLHIFLGDLTGPRFGLSDDDYARLVRTTGSIIHCAASLNRKSEKSCLNVNLRGTLEIIQLARAAHTEHGLRRISHVSTVAVAGHRQDEVVTEDGSIDWNRSDYDPYARTKKFCEHMIHQLLPDIPRTIFRPSIVLGDSRRGATTQFEMVRAFVVLANIPVLPFRPDNRLDIVPVEYVAEAIATLHNKEDARHTTYHLSAGRGAQTFRQLTDALSQNRRRRKPMFAPGLEGTCRNMVNVMTLLRRTPLGYAATLLKVFWPYLTWNTVFDNSRVVAEMGHPPKPFSEYSYPLLNFSTTNDFSYKYRDWPPVAGGSQA